MEKEKVPAIDSGKTHTFFFATANCRTCLREANERDVSAVYSNGFAIIM